MRGWLTGIAAVMLCVAQLGGTTGASIDCGPTPTVRCLLASIFSLAKTLPVDSDLRQQVGWAERELAPVDIKTALEFVITNVHDASPWHSIAWIARAGRLDRAISLAKQQKDAPDARMGGLLEVASRMLDRNDKRSATKIV